jgi:hypothetical protein
LGVEGDEPKIRDFILVVVAIDTYQRLFFREGPCLSVVSKIAIFLVLLVSIESEAVHSAFLIV